jgi:DNA replication protein DnaC
LQLISRRYERGPLILSSHPSFGAWGEVFGDRVIATAILDRVLHHAVTGVFDTVSTPVY